MPKETLFPTEIERAAYVERQRHFAARSQRGWDQALEAEVALLVLRRLRGENINTGLDARIAKVLAAEGRKGVLLMGNDPGLKVRVGDREVSGDGIVWPDEREEGPLDPYVYLATADGCVREHGLYETPRLTVKELAADLGVPLDDTNVARLTTVLYKLTDDGAVIRDQDDRWRVAASKPSPQVSGERSGCATASRRGAPSFHLSDLLVAAVSHQRAVDRELEAEAVRIGAAEALRPENFAQFEENAQGNDEKQALNKKRKLLLKRLRDGEISVNDVHSEFPGAYAGLIPFVSTAREQVKARRKTPWGRVCLEVLKSAPVELSEGRLWGYAHRLLRGAVLETDPVSREVARLHDQGVTDHLLTEVWRDFPDGAQAMGLPSPAGAVEPGSRPPPPSTASEGLEEPTAPQGAAPALATRQVKLPNLGPHDREAYQLWTLHGWTQQRIADELNREHGTTYAQGQVSRMISRAKKHAEASGLSDHIPAPAKSARAIDPTILEMGARRDGRTLSQRERRNPT